MTAYPCTSCGLDKPESEYRTRKHGYRVARCRDCERADQRVCPAAERLPPPPHPSPRCEGCGDMQVRFRTDGRGGLVETRVPCRCERGYVPQRVPMGRTWGKCWQPEQEVGS